MADITFVAERANWTARRLTGELAKELDHHTNLNPRVVHSSFSIRRSLIHFTSFGPRFLWSRPLPVHWSNKVVWTVHHLLPGYEKYTALGAAMTLCHRVHTGCQATKDALLARGVPEDFIVVLPLGIDTSLFQQKRLATRARLRRTYGIPGDRIVLGSFQKDGLGWSDGERPKYEKGPDLLIEAARQLAHSYPITVVLTGPARGYVKRAFRRHGIPFVWVGHLPSLQEVAECYHMCDAYLISSRIEGGPLSLLEAWASGVPVIATRVGMVPDVAQDGKTVLIAKTFSGQALAEKTAQLIENAPQRRQLIENGSRAATRFDWKVLAPQYLNALYRPLLEL